jgi:hypothetical protein
LLNNKTLMNLCDASRNGKIVLHIEGSSKASSQIFKGGGATGEYHHTGEDGEHYYEFSAEEVRKSAEVRENIFGDLIQTGTQSEVTNL